MTMHRPLILGCKGLHLGAAEATFFQQVQPFGFILFARNVETPAQLSALCADLRAAVGRNVPIFTDQEGGRVQRLRAPHWREWAPPLDSLTDLPLEAACRAMWLRMRIIAAELTAVGIDGNCAPLADIAEAQTHAVLRNRCYGTSPERVSAIARACADGLLHGGVLPVLKHIPGHGQAVVDSHLETPTLRAPLDRLRQTDFLPFQALPDLPLGMTGHLVLPEVDPQLPVTVSPHCIALIREEIGFNGLLITDDLSMEALGGTPAERATRARAAGCDVVLHCNGNLEEMRAVAAAAGEFSPQEAARATEALQARQPAHPVDIHALAAEFEALHSERRQDGTEHARSAPL